MMGGAEKIMAKGKELHNQGKYREAMEILNKLVYAEPDNQEAKDLLADVFEQIGYQKESPSVRNSFLAAAYELRNGFPSGVAVQSVSPDTVRAMSTELLLDFIGIRVDSRKAADMRFTINLLTPDNGEKFVVEMSNATLTNIKGFAAENPDLTITINRSDLEPVMAGLSTFEQQVVAGKAMLEGDRTVFEQLRSLLVEFTPDFEIMPGTKPAKAAIASEKDVFEQPQPADTSGG
jgi:alkyl sulfatase BDS1-like metallo-beta-lactamase superfamily hydrolase